MHPTMSLNNLGITQGKKVVVYDLVKTWQCQFLDVFIKFYIPSLNFNIIKQDICITFLKVGQTAGPNGLTFLYWTHGNPGNIGFFFITWATPVTLTSFSYFYKIQISDQLK